ncbi:hypothetical protein SDC9_190059 [bioreactor metagenome]|uniref:Uncharacterized protein n=1 Tax=bioreactor metagenome TaxID=1076179 RepID=A0A645HVL1_9ZZZZ
MNPSTTATASETPGTTDAGTVTVKLVDSEPMIVAPFLVITVQVAVALVALGMPAHQLSGTVKLLVVEPAATFAVLVRVASRAKVTSWL